jgi:hypothetical protein
MRRMVLFVWLLWGGGALVTFGRRLRLIAPIAACVLAAGIAPSRAAVHAPLPITCDVGVVFHDSEPVIGVFVISMTGRGSCVGGLRGPYDLSVQGTGGDCLSADEFGDVCDSWYMHASLQLTSWSSGAVTTLDQWWNAADSLTSNVFLIEGPDVPGPSTGLGHVDGGETCGADCSTAYIRLHFTS